MRVRLLLSSVVLVVAMTGCGPRGNGLYGRLFFSFGGSSGLYTAPVGEPMPFTVFDVQGRSVTPQSVTCTPGPCEFTTVAEANAVPQHLLTVATAGRHTVSLIGRTPDGAAVADEVVLPVEPVVSIDFVGLERLVKLAPRSAAAWTPTICVVAVSASGQSFFGVAPKYRIVQDAPVLRERPRVAGSSPGCLNVDGIGVGTARLEASFGGVTTVSPPIVVTDQLGIQQLRLWELIPTQGRLAFGNTVTALELWPSETRRALVQGVTAGGSALELDPTCVTVDSPAVSLKTETDGWQVTALVVTASSSFDGVTALRFKPDCDGTSRPLELRVARRR